MSPAPDTLAASGLSESRRSYAGAVIKRALLQDVMLPATHAEDVVQSTVKGLSPIDPLYTPSINAPVMVKSVKDIQQIHLFAPGIRTMKLPQTSVELVPGAGGRASAPVPGMGMNKLVENLSEGHGSRIRRSQIVPVAQKTVRVPHHGRIRKAVLPLRVTPHSRASLPKCRVPMTGITIGSETVYGHEVRAQFTGSFRTAVPELGATLQGVDFRTSTGLLGTLAETWNGGVLQSEVPELGSTLRVDMSAALPKVQLGFAGVGVLGGAGAAGGDEDTVGNSLTATTLDMVGLSGIGLSAEPRRVFTPMEPVALSQVPERILS